MSDIFKALFNGETLISEDGQFRIKMNLETIDTYQIWIQHRSEIAHWRAIKSFELAIIQYNDWRVDDLAEAVE